MQKESRRERIAVELGLNERRQATVEGGYIRLFQRREVVTHGELIVVNVGRQRNGFLADNPGGAAWPIG